MENVQNNVLGGIKYMQGQTPAAEAPKTEAPQTFQANTTPVEDGDKKSQDILKWAGIIAAGTLAVGGTIYALKKGKTVKLDDIKFNKGTASLKEGGKKFSGVIKDTLKDGDTIKMTYKEGVLQKSARSGKTAFVKEYAYADGKISKVIKDGKEINIKKLYEEGTQKAKKLQAEAKEKAAQELQGFHESHKKNMEELDKSLQDLRQSLDNIGKNEQEALKKLQQEEIHHQEILKEAASRTKEEQQILRAQNTQEEVFKQMHGTSGKSARQSARSFMTPTERIDDILTDENLVFNARGQKAAKNRAEFLKGLKPDTISALSDDQIGIFMSHMEDKKAYKEVAKILEGRFSADELQSISKSQYRTAFINNLFDAVRQPAQQDKIVNWYKGM